MARDYARLMCSIWDDDDYKLLGLELQGLYCALLAYPRISWCGIIDYIPKRLMRIDPDLTERTLWEKLAKLHNHNRMIQIDTETDEMLVRTFVKHDQILKQPNVAKAMGKAIGNIESWALRTMMISELGKLYTEQPNLKGWGSEGLEQGFGELLEEVYEAAEQITTFRRVV